MKTGLNTVGYTILEVLIVFAITAGLLVTAMTYTAGQQSKNQFIQGINDIHAEINDVINNVQTGYYANVAGFSCSASSTGPDIQTGSTSKGANDACTFIGRAMHFRVDGDPSRYNIYNIAGLRLRFNTLQPVRSYAEAFPTAIYPGASTNTTVPDNAQKITLAYGLRAAYIRYNTNQTANAVAFVTDVAGNNTQTVNLFPIVASNNTAGSVADSIDNVASFSDANKNPNGGVAICFQSGGTNQYGLITINSNQRKLGTKLNIGSGNCP
jgi:hypothetical protein